MDENTEKTEITAYYADGSTKLRDICVLKEHELTIIVNEAPVMRLICTKKDLRELVTGRLLTDGIIKRAAEIEGIYFCKYENEASVFLNHPVEWEEELRAEKSCCTGNRVFSTMKNKEGLKPLAEASWKPEWVLALADRFLDDTRLHSMTQGTHSCLLARGDELLFSAEDIGRHNALDKAVGFALLSGIRLEECMLFTSGRVPLDMLQKVVAARIPVLISKSVPTAEAVTLEKEYCLTLICRAHPDGFIRMS